MVRVPLWLPCGCWSAGFPDPVADAGVGSDDRLDAGVPAKAEPRPSSSGTDMAEGGARLPPCPPLLWTARGVADGDSNDTANSPPFPMATPLAAAAVCTALLMLLLLIRAKERLAREELAAVVQNPRLLLHSLRLLAPLVMSMERDDEALELLHGESSAPLAPSCSRRLEDTDSDSWPWPIPTPKPRCGTRPPEPTPTPTPRLLGGCRCTSRPPPLGTGEAAMGDEVHELDTEA